MTDYSVCVCQVMDLSLSGDPSGIGCQAGVYVIILLLLKDVIALLYYTPLFYDFIIASSWNETCFQRKICLVWVSLQRDMTMFCFT